MQAVAESWLVYRLTGPLALLGVSAFFAQIPVFLQAPLGALFAGTLAEHVGAGAGRRRSAGRGHRARRSRECDC